VYSPLVDKVDMFKTKKLPVEFLSDNKLVFQEYSHLRTIKVSKELQINMALKVVYNEKPEG
jgi:sensor domain CHASE-containing protein